MELSRTLKKDWELTQEAFDRLLACLDADREQAGEKYEVLRLKLIKYFEWQDSLTPEEMADETLNRVARMIYEGATVQNLHSYLFGAARHLASERRKEQRQAQAAIAQLAEVAQSRPADDDTSQQSCLDCCEACLANLPEQSRALIMAYYALEKRAKIDHHKRVAEELGVSLNSLRIRAHRIKLKLENCIVECEAKRGQK